MNPHDRLLRAMTRRQFFGRSAAGIGTMALASLLNENLFAAGAAKKANGRAPAVGHAATPASGGAGVRSSLAVKPPHFAPRAKRVIYLFMAGAPSQLDLFDPKPKLIEHNGRPVPEEMIKGQRFAFLTGVPNLLGSPFNFAKHGQSGADLSELLPHLATAIDDVAFVKSMHGEAFNHDPAQIFMNTGHTLAGRPSMGAWMTYGLGSENADLPGFVVLCSGGADGQPIGAHSWGSGFLPTVYQGVQFRSQGDPVLYVSNPDGIDSTIRRQSLDAVRDLNEAALADVGDPEIATRIAAFEMAYRMQTSVPELMDIASEPRAVHEQYGTEPGKATYANNCLLARRLAERGVRFIQLYHRGWDHHGGAGGQNLVTGLPDRCREVDRPTAALLKDLKQRGMLDDTLIIWGGEFGRTPMLQGQATQQVMGRDHHPRAFTLWLAGGGVKPGVTIGQTDELGYNPVKDKVHIHDLHATILHLMGLNHEKLTHRFQGRDFRLTDVAGEVVTKLLT